MNNTDTKDFEEVAGQDDGDDIQGAEDFGIPDKPLTIDAILARDRRKTDIVEINIANQEATLVESSNAPELTAEVLKEKGVLTVSGTIDIEGNPVDVEVLNGIPFVIEMEKSRINTEYADRKLTEKEEYQRDLNILRLIVSRLYVLPKFSYDGSAGSYPIEEQSDELLESLYLSMSSLITPYSITGTYQSLKDSLAPLKKTLKSNKSKLARKEKSAESATDTHLDNLQSDIETLKDQIHATQGGITLTEKSLTHIYQVQVLRGSPLHSALLSDSFEIYPTGEGKPVKEMADDEIDERVERYNAQRNAFVASMIISPGLSWNGVGQKGAYPVEQIGENMMQGLHNAHRATNLKPGGLNLLKRFRSVDTDRVWKGAST